MKKYKKELEDFFFAFLFFIMGLFIVIMFFYIPDERFNQPCENILMEIINIMNFGFNLFAFIMGLIFAYMGTLGMRSSIHDINKKRRRITGG